MKRAIIGIDPDVTKSGFATLEIEDGKPHITLETIAFPELVERLCSLKGSGTIIAIEKGWFNDTNYHLKNKGQHYATRQGIDIGRNHETGRKIVEMARHYGLQVEEITPLRKVWRGAGGKISHAEIVAFMGPVGRCNQDARDAALIAWTCAHLPIRLPV